MRRKTPYGIIPEWAVDVRKTPGGRLICTNDDKRFLYLDEYEIGTLDDEIGSKNESLIIKSVVVHRVSTINEQFKSYVSGSAFNLSLSRNMVIALLDIYNDTSNDERLLSTTYNSLISRGLLVRDGVIKVTEEGELVARLLEISGYGEQK